MRKVILNVAASTVVVLMSVPCLAQKMMVYTSVDNNCMQRSAVSLSGKAAVTPLLSVDAATDPIVTYRAWGTTFNEQHWRALNILSEADREEVMRRFWSPTGDLHLTRGRVAMNGKTLSGWPRIST